MYCKITYPSGTVIAMVACKDSTKQDFGITISKERVGHQSNRFTMYINKQQAIELHDELDKFINDTSCT